MNIPLGAVCFSVERRGNLCLFVAGEGAVCTDLVEKKQLYVTHTLYPAGSSEFLFFQGLPYVYSSNSLK